MLPQRGVNRLCSDFAITSAIPLTLVFIIVSIAAARCFRQSEAVGQVEGRDLTVNAARQELVASGVSVFLSGGRGSDKPLIREPL